MANEEVRFVDFLRGCLHPKLSWIMAQLVILGVNHRLQGKGMSGPILQVEAGQVEQAWAVLITPVGMMNVGGSLTDENILVMDLRDDHPFFESDTDIEEMALPTTAPIPADEPLNPILPIGITPAPDPGDEFDKAIGLVPSEEDPFETNKEPTMPQLVSTKPVLKKSLEGEADPEEDDSLWEADDEETDPFADETVENDDGSTTTFEDETEDTSALDYMRAKDMLKNAEVQWSGVKGPVLMYEVDSANISGIGCRTNQTDQSVGTVYGQFKGGAQPYRYGPVLMDNFNHILSEAVRKAEGHPEASVGSAFHHLIKSEADEGNIKCQRLEANGKWTDVPTKAERTKALKEKKKEK